MGITENKEFIDLKSANKIWLILIEESVIEKDDVDITEENNEDDGFEYGAYFGNNRDYGNHQGYGHNNNHGYGNFGNHGYGGQGRFGRVHRTVPLNRRTMTGHIGSQHLGMPVFTSHGGDCGNSSYKPPIQSNFYNEVNDVDAVNKVNNALTKQQDVFTDPAWVINALMEENVLNEEQLGNAIDLITSDPGKYTLNKIKEMMLS